MKTAHRLVTNEDSQNARHPYEPHFFVFGEERAERLERLGTSVFVIRDEDDSVEGANTGQDDGAESDDLSVGFKNVVVLIPTESLLSFETYLAAENLWSWNLRYSVPIWMVHWSSDFDERLEKGDRTVIAVALDKAVFEIRRDVSSWAADFLMRFLPSLPRTDELLHSLAWFMESLKNYGGKQTLIEFRRSLWKAGFERAALRRAEQERVAITTSSRSTASSRQNLSQTQSRATW